MSKIYRNKSTAKRPFIKKIIFDLKEQLKDKEFKNHCVE